MSYQLEIRIPNIKDEKYLTGYVYFEKELQREKYIREEFVFCKYEEKSYLTALYSNQRSAAVKILYNRRVEYAKLNGLTIDMTRIS